MQAVPVSESTTDRSAGAAPTLPRTGFVRQRLLLQFVPASRSTLWRWIKAGLFPAPVRLSAGITAWRAEDIHRWIEERATAQKAAA